MHWIMLTDVEARRIWVNIARFDIMYRDIEEDFTIIAMVIDEDVTNKIHVMEKPEDIYDMLEKKNERKNKA